MPTYQIKVALRFTDGRTGVVVDTWSLEAANQAAAASQALAWQGPPDMAIRSMVLTEPGQPGVVALRQDSTDFGDVMTE